MTTPTIDWTNGQLNGHAEAPVPAPRPGRDTLPTLLAELCELLMSERQPLYVSIRRGNFSAVASVCSEDAAAVRTVHLSKAEERVCRVLTHQPRKGAVIARLAGYRALGYVRGMLSSLVRKGVAEYVPGGGYRRPVGEKGGPLA